MKKFVTAILAALIAITCCGFASAESEEGVISYAYIYDYGNSYDDSTSITYYTFNGYSYESDLGMYCAYFVADDYSGSQLVLVFDPYIETGSYYSCELDEDDMPFIMLMLDGYTGEINMSACMYSAINSDMACDLDYYCFGNNYFGSVDGEMVNDTTGECSSYYIWFDFTCEDSTSGGSSAESYTDKPASTPAPSPVPTAEPKRGGIDLL